MKTKQIMNQMLQMVKSASELSHLLSDPYRKKIIEFIDKEPKQVKDIKEHIGLSWKSTIAHLNILEQAGIIKRTPQITDKGKIIMVSLTASQDEITKKLFQPVGTMGDKLAKMLKDKDAKKAMDNYRKDKGL